MEVPTPPIRDDLDVPDATVSVGVACADLTTFCRLDELGLEVTGQRLDPDRTVLACRVVDLTSGAGAAGRRDRRGTP